MKRIMNRLVCLIRGHQWGAVVREANFDQRCARCGAWRSGYGRKW